MAADLLQVIGMDGKTMGVRAPDLTEEELRSLHRTMVRVRALDERGMNLQRQGRINFYVPSTGQEASQVGSAFAFEKDDWFFPSYRNPGVFLHRGASVQELLHQLFGNRRDRAKGRQMPNHYAFADLHLVSISSPIATQLPQAVGAAMAARIKKRKTVVGTYLGDGGTSEGDFHVAMNFAGVYKAPVVFICENNGWAITVPASRQTASESFAVKSAAYGFPGVRVDGNDVLAVYQVAREAVDRARAGEGPTLIETVTYRMGPHSTSDDPRRYRDQREVDEWKARDPIERFRRHLFSLGILSEREEAEVWDQARDEVQAAVAAAEAEPPPRLREMFEDVYAEMTPDLARQLAEARRFHPDPE